MNLRPLSAWEDPRFPVSGLPADLDAVTAIVWHYPGGSVKLPSSDGEMVALLRQMDASHRARKPSGYSLAYNFVIMPDGSVWTARGLEVRCAANGSGSWNLHGIAAQFVVSGDSDITPAQVSAAQDLARWLTDLLGRDLDQFCHGDVRSQVWPKVNTSGPWTTSCPGPTLRARVRAGDFLPPIPDPPLVLPEEADMVILDSQPGSPAWVRLVSTGTHLAHVVDGHYSNVLDRAQPSQAAVVVSRDELLSTIRSTVVKPGQPCPEPWRADGEIAMRWVEAGGSAA